MKEAIKFYSLCCSDTSYTRKMITSTRTEDLPMGAELGPQSASVKALLEDSVKAHNVHGRSHVVRSLPTSSHGSADGLAVEGDDRQLVLAPQAVRPPLGPLDVRAGHRQGQTLSSHCSSNL